MPVRDQFILFQDGTGTWWAAPPGFRDLVVDPTGWGASREEAVANLLNDSAFQKRAKRERWPTRAVADFVEVPEPDGSRFVEIAYLSDDPYPQATMRRKAFKVVPGGKVTVEH